MPARKRRDPGTRRLRLRSRLLAAFVGGSLFLSAAVAFLSYGLTRRYLLSQRQTSAQRQAQVNARLVGGALRSDSDVPQLLSSLQSPAGSSTVVHHRGRWFAASLELGRDALPEPLQEAVVEGRRRARQRHVIEGAPRLAVGLPLNLVENASLHGGGVDRVRIEASDGMARIVVEDRGPGVPAEDRERIFERFYRGRYTSRPAGGGVGLGLALVAEHVALHGGRVWVEDRATADGGARFVVELPVVR